MSIFPSVLQTFWSTCAYLLVFNTHFEQHCAQNCSNCVQKQSNLVLRALTSYKNNIFGTNIIFTWIAAVLASSIVSIPLMVRPIIVSMSEINENLEKSARILGASYIKTFISITLPLSYKGITAGILLGFIRAFSEFGATIIVAGNIPGKTQTVPLAIYTNIITGNNDEVFKMVAICLALSITSILIYTKLVSATTK